MNKDKIINSKLTSEVLETIGNVLTYSMLEKAFERIKNTTYMPRIEIVSKDEYERLKRAGLVK